MTFDPSDPATWPEDMRSIDPNELRKFADAVMCMAMAIDEGAVDTRIELQTDPRIAMWAARMLDVIRADAPPGNAEA